jgi:hypothetical protein
MIMISTGSRWWPGAFTQTRNVTEPEYQWAPRAGLGIGKYEQSQRNVGEYNEFA